MGFDPVTIAVGAGIEGVGNLIAGDQKRRAASSAAGARQSGFETAREDIVGGTQAATDALNPFAQAGGRALSQFEKMLSGDIDIENSPTFKLRKQLFEKDLAQQLAAAGKGRSELGVQQFAVPGLQKLQAEEIQSQFSRLNPLLNLGFKASTGISGLESQAGTNLANLSTAGGASGALEQTQLGNIGAATTAGVTNAATGGLQDLVSLNSFNQAFGGS